MKQAALIDQAQAADYVFGSLAWSATRWREVPGALDEALSAYRRICGHGHNHLPFFLLLDLVVMVRLGWDTPFVGEHDDVLQQRYTGELLARILQERSVEQAIGVCAANGLPEQRGRLLELLLQQLAPCWPTEQRINPAYVRQLGAAGASRHVDGGDAMAEPLARFLEHTSERVRFGALVLDEDAFELEHWSALSSAALRLGCRQILALVRQMGDLDPRGIVLAEEAPEVEAAYFDETHYPTGGLSELTNRGSLESLVPSELMYANARGQNAEVDLFDLRMAEGSLLYYLRDDGVLRRKRRTVHLVIDVPHRFNHKPTGWGWQVGILGLSLFLRLLTDLESVFEHDALRFTLTLVGQAESHAELTAELGIAEVLLAGRISHGKVTLGCEPSVNMANLAERGRKTYLLALCGADALAGWTTRLETARGQTPSLLGHAFVLPASGDVTTLAALRTELADALVGGVGRGKHAKR